MLLLSTFYFRPSCKISFGKIVMPTAVHESSTLHRLVISLKNPLKSLQKKQYTFLSLNPELLLAYMCFCLNYKNVINKYHHNKNKLITQQGTSFVLVD